MSTSNDYDAEEIAAMLDEPASMHVPFYLARLTDGEVAKLERFASKIMHEAPAVGGWLHGVALREAWRRRAAVEFGAVYDVEAIRFPIELDNEAVAAGLGAVAAACEAVESCPIGELLDKISWALIVIAQHRLRKFRGSE